MCNGYRGITPLGTEGSPLLPVKEGRKEDETRQEGVRQNLQLEGKKNMLWEEQTTPLSCGVGCPVKAEIDEAKKDKTRSQVIMGLGIS